MIKKAKPFLAGHTNSIEGDYLSKEIPVYHYLEEHIIAERESIAKELERIEEICDFPFTADGIVCRVRSELRTLAEELRKPRRRW